MEKEQVFAVKNERDRPCFVALYRYVYQNIAIFKKRGVLPLLKKTAQLEQNQLIR